MRIKDKKKEIMLYEHAVRIIVRNGFDGLSMQKLAKAVDISVATIYVYFSSKEDMLFKVYNRVAQEQANAINTGFDPLMPFADGLWLLWKNHFEYHTGSPVHARFLQQFRHSPLISAHTAVENTHNNTMAIFFQNAMRKNELNVLPQEMIKALSFGPLHHILHENDTQTELYTDHITLNERKLKKLFEQVLKTLQP